MRGNQDFQGAMFSYISLEERVPATHPLRKLAALVRAEKAAERAQKARADAARIINAEKAAERKARDHELYQSAGLLILAGLVDTTTGKPTRDRGELLGALVSLAEAQVDDEKRAAWKRKGDALLAERARR